MNFVVLFCHRFVINTSHLRPTQQRQAHFKERADSEGTFHAYLAAVGLDNPLHNRQAQSAAAWLVVAWLAATAAAYSKLMGEQLFE